MTSHHELEPQRRKLEEYPKPVGDQASNHNEKGGGALANKCAQSLRLDASPSCYGVSYGDSAEAPVPPLPTGAAPATTVKRGAP